MFAFFNFWPFVNDSLRPHVILVVAAKGLQQQTVNIKRVICPKHGVFYFAPSSGALDNAAQKYAKKRI